MDLAHAGGRAGSFLGFQNHLQSPDSDRRQPGRRAYSNTLGAKLVTLEINGKGKDAGSPGIYQKVSVATLPLASDIARTWTILQPADYFAACSTRCYLGSPCTNSTASATAPLCLSGPANAGGCFRVGTRQGRRVLPSRNPPRQAGASESDRSCHPSPATARASRD